MLIIHGTYMLGKVDQVPRLLYVKTKFFHLNFLPLIPLGSFVIMEGSEKDQAFQGASIPMSWKSVFTTYLRAGLILAGSLGLVFSAIGSMELLNRAKHPGIGTQLGVTLGIACAAWLALAGSYRVTRAGPLRALTLAGAAGIPPEAVAAHFADKLSENELERLARHSDAQKELSGASEDFT